MGLKSTTRDKREFRHYAVIADDGSISAITFRAEGTPAPEDTTAHTHVDVTDLHPYDFTDVTVSHGSVVSKDRAAIHASLKAQNKGRGKDRG
jgi:hypothetical protein